MLTDQEEAFIAFMGQTGIKEADLSAIPAEFWRSYL
jgi:hypothetical protein